jgi:peptide/nickel transport system permease protein
VTALRPLPSLRRGARRGRAGRARWRRGLPVAAAVAGAVLVALAVALLTLELWRPLDTYALDRGAILQPPSLAHPFGTDNLGRDMFTWSLHGLRTSLVISLGAAIAAVVLGAALGVLAGARGGWVDAVVMRVVDVFASQSHFLFGLLLLVLLRPAVGPAIAIAAAVGLTHWVTTARVVRAELLSLRTRPFVAAAIDAGASRWQVVRWHHLRNVLPSILLAFVLTAPHAVFHEMGYSFLGLGMPLDSPSLGRVLGLGQANILAGGWWVSVLPGLLLFVTAACIGVLGERLRDRLDPTLGAELRL